MYNVDPFPNFDTNIAPCIHRQLIHQQLCYSPDGQMVELKAVQNCVCGFESCLGHFFLSPPPLSPLRLGKGRQPCCGALNNVHQVPREFCIRSTVCATELRWLRAAVLSPFGAS